MTTISAPDGRTYFVAPVKAGGHVRYLISAVSAGDDRGIIVDFEPAAVALGMLYTTGMSKTEALEALRFTTSVHLGDPDLAPDEVLYHRKLRLDIDVFAPDHSTIAALTANGIAQGIIEGLPSEWFDDDDGESYRLPDHGWAASWLTDIAAVEQ